MQSVKMLSVEVGEAFEKEAQLVDAIKAGDLDYALLIWQPKGKTLVLPASKRWQTTPALAKELDALGWQLLSRRTGGAPVPQTTGVLNVSHIYLVSDSYTITQGYEELCAALTAFFAQYQLTADIHAAPGAYCDGDYNLNINGQKIVGTAQRVSRTKAKSKMVLAQACILLEGELSELIAPVNLCNQHNQNPDRIVADAHTTLAKRLSVMPTLDDLCDTLAQTFKRDM